MVIVSVSPQGKLYVITWLPAPAVAGSNVPVDAFVIPVPLQVPPVSAAIKFTLEAFEQKGPAWVIVASHDAEQEGSVPKPFITKVFPSPSVTRMVSFPAGGTTVTPVPKLENPAGELQVVTGVTPFKHELNGNPCQLYPQAVHWALLVIGVEVAEFQAAHVYVGAPPETVKLPLDSKQTDIDEQEPTTTWVEYEPQANVYVTV